MRLQEARWGKIMGMDKRGASRGKPEFFLVRPLLFFVPLAAGAGIGAFINLALVTPFLANRFWYGVEIDPKAAPPEALINVAAISATVVLWVAFAFLIRKGRDLADALVREAVAFAPALSVLALCAIENYGLAPVASLYGVHAVVFSLAGFAAVNAFHIAAGGRQRADLREGRGAGCAVTSAALVYFMTFSLLGIFQYYSLRIQYTDTADWEQMLWNTLRGRFLITSAFPHMFFGEHVQVIHLALLPIYAVFPSLITLMIVKSAILASGALPVYLLSKRRLASKGAAACFAIAYLAYPAMQYTDIELAMNTFRPEALAITALLWAVYLLEVERLGWLAVACLAAVASKEEMALPVAMIGLLLIFKRRWVWGTAFFACAVAWFLACLLWIIPHYRGAPTHMYKYYLDFGDNPTFSGILLHIISHPLHTLGVIFRPVKIDYLLLLLVPLGLRPLFSWRMLLVMLPSLGTTLLASREPSFTIYYYFQISIVPFMVMGAVYGSENCVGLVSLRNFIAPSLDAVAKKRALTAAFAVLVLASSLAGNVLFAKSPMSLLFYNPHMDTYWRTQYAPTERSRQFFREVRPLVPPDASVSATEFAATYFAARKDDYAIPQGVGHVDYIVLDTREEWLTNTKEKLTAFENVLKAPGYDRIYEKDGFIVMKKSMPQGAGGG